MLWRSTEMSIPREPIQVQFVRISHVPKCPYMEESLDILRNASVCTLKHNVFGPEVTLLSMTIS